MAEGEERDHEGRRDDRAALRGAVEQRQQEQRGRRPEHGPRERRADVDEQDFAQVLRVQEEDRVRGKQDGVQGKARQRTRFGRARPVTSGGWELKHGHPKTQRAMADHYAVLGVSPDANRSAIQAAYRDLARRHHPDFGGDGSKMAALNEAWSVLGRDETRTGVRRHATNYATARGAWQHATARRRPDRSPLLQPAGASTRADARSRFGRYADWTVSELAAHDPDYLEWLARAPAGLTFRQEIYTELARRPAAYPGRTATATRPPSRSRFGRPRLW